MRTITLEEHFAPPGFLDGPARELKERFQQSGERGRLILEQIVDIGEKRIAEMDAAGIDMQVLSMSVPGLQGFTDASVAVPLAIETNDHVAAAVKAHPARFAGFAVLPTADPAASAKELERTVTRLGFKGAMINGHTQGSFLDDKKYWRRRRISKAMRS